MASGTASGLAMESASVSFVGALSNCWRDLADAVVARTRASASPRARALERTVIIVVVISSLICVSVGGGARAKLACYFWWW